MKQTIVTLAVSLSLLLTLFVIFAPGFLLTGGLPQKADAVVLFVGPDGETRLERAKQLIREGYARNLIIPYSGELLSAAAADRLMWNVSGSQPKRDILRGKRVVDGYGKYFENTHIEALEAKRIMDEWGLNSALLVSSSYHMRRIGLIAGRVFDDRYTITLIPASRPGRFSAADWLDLRRSRTIAGEYVKMAWFGVYETLRHLFRSTGMPPG